MNRDELLDKLAMELAEWPEKGTPLAKLTSLPEVSQWKFGNFTGQWVAWPGAANEKAIGVSDWCKRRAELINRPSWDEAPEWAERLAQDGNGNWYWHSRDVVINDSDSEWIPVNLAGARWRGPVKGTTPAGHNWRETLEERPDECEPTVEEDEAFNAMAAMAEQPHVTDARRLDAMLAEDMGKDSVGATLDERGKRYGDFSEGAAIMQSLKSEAHGTEGWQRLNYAQREAVDMILHKIGRVLNGDPDYADNWHDIAGYAQLVERTLTK